MTELEQWMKYAEHNTSETKEKMYIYDVVLPLEPGESLRKKAVLSFPGMLIIASPNIGVYTRALILTDVTPTDSANWTKIVELDNVVPSTPIYPTPPIEEVEEGHSEEQEAPE
jgi:hypothetical protein